MDVSQYLQVRICPGFSTCRVNDLKINQFEYQNGSVTSLPTSHSNLSWLTASLLLIKLSLMMFFMMILFRVMSLRVSSFLGFVSFYRMKSIKMSSPRGLSLGKKLLWVIYLSWFISSMYLRVNIRSAWGIISFLRLLIPGRSYSLFCVLTLRFRRRWGDPFNWFGDFMIYLEDFEWLFLKLSCDYSNGSNSTLCISLLW